MVMDLKYQLITAHRYSAVAHRAPHHAAVMELKYHRPLQLQKLRVPPEKANRSLVGILSAVDILANLRGRVSSGRNFKQKVVMERVPAVVNLGSEGTSGQTVTSPTHQDYGKEHPAKPCCFLLNIRGAEDLQQGF